jgi:hypothetical protein
MRATAYVYDSETAEPHVEAVLAALEAREEAVAVQDVADADDPADARREAMLTVKSAVRIGRSPAGVYGEDGSPDFSAGALITEAETGRRSLHVGREALAALGVGDDDDA